MTHDQFVTFLVLAASLALFAWGRWRYDLVAAGAMVAVIVAGIVPPEEALRGFGHPAVITVAAVLVISRALRNSGIVGMLARKIRPLTGRPVAHVAALTAVVTVLSAFMNNVGALALMLPVALATAEEHDRSPAMLLMPLAFGSILGGLMTMIGTPPNIIIATYRTGLRGEPFGLFDFAPVGVPVAVAGLLFVSLLGWRLIPRERRGRTAPQKLFEIGDYITEVRVGEESRLIGQRLHAVQDLGKADVIPVGLVREGHTIVRPSIWHHLRAGDILILKADPADLKPTMDQAGLEFTGAAADAVTRLKAENVGLVEAVVTPGSPVEGRAPYYLYRRSGGSLTLLAIARQNRPIHRRPWAELLQAGDVLLMQAELATLADTLAEFGLLPLAERDLLLGKPRRVGMALAVFGAAIAANLLGLVPITLAFLIAVIAYVVLDILPVRDLYKGIDWPVIVLLGAMIPVGRALEISGGTALIANSVVAATEGLSAVWVLTLIFVVTMFVSDVINNAATALVMAPIAAGVAENLGVRADPFLMAVAVGASCAFLTPIGHQSNTLVMGPGGYKFGDYWRMGLPLELAVVVIAVPMIVWVWPL